MKKVKDPVDWGKWKDFRLQIIKEEREILDEKILDEKTEKKILKKQGDVELQYVRRHDDKEWLCVSMPGGVFIFDVEEKKEAESKFKEVVNFLKGMERTK